MNRQFITILGAFMLMASTAVNAQDQRDPGFLSDDDYPTSSRWIDAPAAIDDPLFGGDFIRYQWGKQQRVGKSLEDAVRDQHFELDIVIPFFANLTGLDVSRKNTPEIFLQISRSIADARVNNKAAKNYYQRYRPMKVFNEGSVEPSADEYGFSSFSYPSGHSVIAYASAFAITEIAPENVDTVMWRSRIMGINRIIAGFHYESDLLPAMVVAAATFAQLHNNADYQAQLAKAREEYRQMKGIKAQKVRIGKLQPGAWLTAETRPCGAHYLALPADTNAVEFYDDWMQYQMGKKKRTPERMQVALADTAITFKGVMNRMEEVLGFQVTEKELPATYALLQKAHADFLEVCSSTAQKARKRPYVKAGDASGLPELDSTLSPTTLGASCHSSVGFGFGLLLSELFPEKKDDLIARGLDYGKSRVIAGLEYMSDVWNARSLSAATFACLNADYAYLAQLDKAKKEIKKWQAKLAKQKAA